MIDGGSHDILLVNIIRRRESLDNICASLRGTRGRAIKELSIRTPKFTPPELGFLRTVSWLYVLYNEAGRIDVKFLKDKLDGYGEDPDSRLSAHFDLVRHLRTYLQHNLDPIEDHDYRIKTLCEHWIHEHSGTVVPDDDRHWNACLSALLTEADRFLAALFACARKIEDDEAPASVLREWELRHQRSFAPHEFDAMIIETAEDMGRLNLDAAKLRNKHYSRWIEELSVRKADCDYPVEARKLVENTLLADTIKVLPFTGADIMKEFDLPRGQQVGALLDLAQKLSIVNSFSRDELLGQLRTHLEESK